MNKEWAFIVAFVCVVSFMPVGCDFSHDADEEVENIPPTVSMAVSSVSGELPFAVSFTSSSDDTDGNVVSFSWDFGGLSTAEGQSVDYTFTKAGSFLVTLTVTDDDGASAETEQVILVGISAKTYGGEGFDLANSIANTVEDGVVIAGQTNSLGAGDYDIWVMVLGDNDVPLWQKAIGGVGSDIARSVVQTADEGFVVAGSTDSFGTGEGDALVVKMDGSGDIEWQRAYGTPRSDEVRSIKEVVDDGFIVVGMTTNIKETGYLDFPQVLETDAWVLRLDGSGNIVWQFAIGGEEDDYATDVCLVSDGGFLVVGHTRSSGFGDWDCWAIKLDFLGGVVWQKTYGTASGEEVAAVAQSADGGFVVLGRTAGPYDYKTLGLVIKLDADGGVLWQKTFENADWITTKSLVQESDGSVVFVGDADPIASGDSDLILVKMSIDGDIEWQKSYGGGFDEYGSGVVETGDGTYAISGYAASYGAGEYDCWSMEVDVDGDIAEFGQTLDLAISDGLLVVSDTVFQGVVVQDVETVDVILTVNETIMSVEKQAP